MRLAISSAALPGRTPAELAQACGPRGLAGIEIVLGAIPSADDARAWRALAAPVIALRAETLEVAGSPELARIAGLLEAPVVVPAGLLPREHIVALAPGYAAQGATLLVEHRSDLDEVRSAAALAETSASGALGVAWEIRPLEDDLEQAGQILLAGGPHLMHIRLHGGGPEQRDNDGRGVGDVFVQLALARYPGTVALTPSAGTPPGLWERWAEGSRPAGCGSAAPIPGPVSGRLEIDVRPVEPKDRIETVLGAYDRVGPGGTLQLVVDHDPDCMRHMLNATRTEGSFSFEYRERGPEIWRVDVVRQAPS